MTKQLIQQLLDEVKQMRFALLLLAEDKISERISTIISTKERRKVWMLMDGTKSTAEIAGSTKLSMRAIQLLVSDLSNLNLVESIKRGYPKRMLDFVPSEWSKDE